MQQGLKAGSNDWISLHRDYDAAECERATQDVNGTNEVLMRNQFRAWAQFMTADMEER
jgi:hypothetical protein